MTILGHSRANLIGSHVDIVCIKENWAVVKMNMLENNFQLSLQINTNFRRKFDKIFLSISLNIYFGCSKEPLVIHFYLEVWFYDLRGDPMETV